MPKNLARESLTQASDAPCLLRLPLTQPKTTHTTHAPPTTQGPQHAAIVRATLTIRNTQKAHRRRVDARRPGPRRATHAPTYGRPLLAGRLRPAHSSIPLPTSASPPAPAPLPTASITTPATWRARASPKPSKFLRPRISLKQTHEITDESMTGPIAPKTYPCDIPSASSETNCADSPTAHIMPERYAGRIAAFGTDVPVQVAQAPTTW
mmetsp:Transcript_22548/g.71526  ORF Transcript_22548/g.71526 Transcript_22548/m.71526 type:complete len:209 (-) Transcript_22548:349-975(-)